MLAAFTAAALAAGLAIVGGCQTSELGSAKNGLNGRALAPQSVQQYAQQRGMTQEQARQELQQKVSQSDEDQAIENIDAVGVKQP